MSEALSAVQMGIAGIAVGAATAWTADFVFSKALEMTGMNQPNSAMNNLGQTGRALTQIVVAGSFGALMMYGGDKVLEMITNGNDPLYHVLYYQVAFSTSATIMSAARGVRVVLDQAVMAGQSPAPAAPKAPLEQTRDARNAAVAASYQNHRMGGAKKGCLSGTGCGQ